MKLSAVVVNFFASQEVALLVESLRQQCRDLALPLQLILVDHSENRREAEQLAGLAPDQLLVAKNRGYAAGVNLGLAHAQGDWFLVANPDVIMGPGALEAFVVAASRFPICGPRFQLGQLLLPPAEGHFLVQEALALVAHYLTLVRRKLFAHAVAQSLVCWRAKEAIPCPFLSGALLFFSRQAWERVGPWDEGFFLYYEETDWLLRAARKGLRAAYVPQAQVVHAWGKSAHPTAHIEVMRRSRQRFLMKNFGPFGWLLARVPLPSLPFPERQVPKSLAVEEEVLWLFSPTPLGLPAAGLFAQREFPEEPLRQSLSLDRHPPCFLVAAYALDSGKLYGPWRWNA